MCAVSGVPLATGSCQLLEAARYDELLSRIGHVAVSCCEDRLVLVWGGYRELYTGVTEYHSPRELLVYDSDLEVWQIMLTLPGEEMPPPLSGATAAVHHRDLYIFGGFPDSADMNGNNNTLYRLTLDTLRWQKVTPSGLQPLPCDKLVSWIFEGRLFLFGGFGPPPPPSSSDRYTHVSRVVIDSLVDERCWIDQLVCYDVASDEWQWPEVSGPRPGPRAAHAAALLGSSVFIFGGRMRRRLNDFYRLDLTTMRWHQIHDCCLHLDVDDSDSGGDSESSSGGQMSVRRRSRRLERSLPLPRSWHSLTRLNGNSLLLFGGFSQHNRPLRDVWLFYTDRCKWSRVPGRLAPLVLLGTADWFRLDWTMPQLMWHTASPVGCEEVLVVGGVNNSVYHFDKTFARDWLVLRRSPKPLRRICLDVIVGHCNWKHLQWSDEAMLGLPEDLRQCILYRCSVGRGGDSKEFAHFNRSSVVRNWQLSSQF